MSSGDQIQVLMLAWETLYQLIVFPRPLKFFHFLVILCLLVWSLLFFYYSTYISKKHTHILIICPS